MTRIGCLALLLACSLCAAGTETPSMGPPRRADGVALENCRIVVPDSPVLRQQASSLLRLLQERGAKAQMESPSQALDESGLRLRTPKKPQGLPRVLSVEEVEAFLGQIVPSGPLGQRDLAALELLYGCGLRVSELLSLRDGDDRVVGMVCVQHRDRTLLTVCRNGHGGAPCREPVFK